MKNQNCNKCKELFESRHQVTWGYGNLNSKIMFVGEAPGRHGCDITGIPFTKDRSGKLFQECLNFVGWNKEIIYTTNIVKCCPPNNRTPINEEIKNCEEYLWQEINEVNPKIIVLLGKTAIEWFCGEQKYLKPLIMNIITKKDYILIPLYHPAYIVRNEKQMKQEYLEQFKKIKEIYENETK